MRIFINVSCSRPCPAVQAKDGVYAAYAAIGADNTAKAADIAALGINLGAKGTFAATKDYCDSTPACIGIKVATNSGASDWQAFSGDLKPGATAKVKFYGANLTSWIAEASA